MAKCEERSNNKVAATKRECDGHTLAEIHQISSHQQESNISVQWDQASEQSLLTEKGDKTQTKAEERCVDLESEGVKSCEKTTVTDAKPGSFDLHPEHDVGITAENCSNVPKPQVSPPTPEDCDECCVTVSEEQRSATENSEGSLERNQLTVPEELLEGCMGEVNYVREEADVNVPVRKKRRMGMCGLTEKERSHFLQVGKREIRRERAEKQMCRSKDDIKTSPLLPTSPLCNQESSCTQPKGEVQSHHCSGQVLRSTKVEEDITEGTNTVCELDRSSMQTHKAIVGQMSEPEKSISPPTVQVEERLGFTEQQEADDSPAIDSCVHPPGDEEQLDHGTITSDETSEETNGEAGGSGGAEAGASSPSIQQEGFNYESVELCKATALPSGSVKKGNGCPEGETGSSLSTPTMAQSKIVHPTDPAGPGCIGYVLDSQLDSLCWTDDELMPGDKTPGSLPPSDDATDLISGLIRELSSLNRTVMASHRELESLRRGTKSSRSSIR